MSSERPEETRGQHERERERETDTALAASKAAGILGAILGLGALGLYGPRAAVSVFLGAAIAVANLLTMRAIIRSLLVVPDEPDEPDESKDPREHKSAGRRGGIAWGVFAVLKILILFGGIWILLTRQLVDPMALAVGYGVLPLGIALASLWSSLRPHR
jgi:hypothetical protein